MGAFFSHVLGCINTLITLFTHLTQTIRAHVDDCFVADNRELYQRCFETRKIIPNGNPHIRRGGRNRGTKDDEGDDLEDENDPMDDDNFPTKGEAFRLIPNLQTLDMAMGVIAAADERGNDLPEKTRVGVNIAAGYLEAIISFSTLAVSIVAAHTVASKEKPKTDQPSMVGSRSKAS